MRLTYFKHDTRLANDLLQQFYLKVIHRYDLVHDGYCKWGESYLLKMIKLELFTVNKKAKSMQRLAEEYCFRQGLDENTHYELAPDWELDELLQECLSAKDYAIITHYLP